ncbi:MAG: choice-of-anchor D domain-containing protein [Myxococcales bacterium]|nr:choice-of-anchor D domain-containing protein [Myxococcales bacterium]
MKHTHLLLFLAALLTPLWACDDDPAGAAEDAMVAAADRGPRIVPDQAVSPADGGPAPDSAVAPDQGPAPDQGIAPDCVIDEDCGPDAVCDRGRCIEGTRCGEGGECPVGRICVANVCIADPRAAGGLVVDPGRILFPFGEVGEEVFRGFEVRNDGDDTLEITRFEFTGDPQWALDMPPALPLRLVPGQSQEMAIRYVADDEQDDQGALRVHSDAGTTELELVTQHKVVGGADPCLQAMPARLDFGAVARGADRTLDLNLVSCGMVPVTVNAIRRGNSIFGALPDTFQLTNPPVFPLVIQPGMRVPVQVTYSPRRAGIEGGYWEVFNDDPANPRLRVDVSALANPPPLQDIALHVRLNWDTDLTDVDLHLIGPNGQIWTCDGDCYFSNPNPNWGDPNEFRDDPFLDVDDVDGFGPENINLEAPAPGTYRVVVQYWADHGGDDPDAVVEILQFGQVVGRYGPQNLSRVNDVWDVVELDWPGQQRRPLGGVNNQAVGNLCGGF